MVHLRPHWDHCSDLVLCNKGWIAIKISSATSSCFFANKLFQFLAAASSGDVESSEYIEHWIFFDLLVVVAFFQVEISCSSCQREILGDLKGS